MRRQTITCLLYEKAKTTCSYTVLYQDSSSQSQFGDICCYVHHQGLSLAIVKQHRTVTGSFITYKGFNLLNQMSQVVYCNLFVAVKLEQLRDICVKVEVAGKNEEIVDALNLILNDFKVWCYKNHLTVHTGKTVAMLISSHAFVGPMRPLMFGDSYIYFNTKSTCLGVEIDYKLNWKPQVKALHIKFGGKLKFLKKFKGLPPRVLEEIYFKGIVPSITYCIAIWGSCSPSTFKVLEHLHLKAAKLIHKLSSETPDSDVLDLAKWKPLGYIYKRRLASIMYQVFHNSLPDQLTALFKTRNTDNSYNLRRINDFSHVRYNCNQGRNSVRYRGPIVWNLIPKAIRDASSQQLFKQKLRHPQRMDQIQFEKEACQITSKQTDFLYF